MLSFGFAREELSRLFGRRLLRLAIVVVMLIPLLYGALYLWAFWDPYARLDAVPVALVNLDRPARAGDATLTAGADLAKELRDRETFGWAEVSAFAARRGVENGTYYFSLTIPEGFSASLASADSARPHKARLDVALHESKSMLGSQIGAKVFSEVRTAAAESASKDYFDTVLLGIADVREGLVDAADGADQLATGLEDADDGAAALSSGAYDAHEGGAKLASGLGRLSTGATSLVKGADALSSGTEQLADGASELAGGSRSLASGAEKVAGGAQSMANGMKELAGGSNKLAGASAELAQGAGQLDAGVAAAQDKIGEAADGAAQVRDGAKGVSGLLASYAAAHPEAASDPAFAKALGTARAVSDGSSALASGLDSARTDAGGLAAGAHQVAAGASQLSAGVAQLDNGVAAAYAGAGELAEGASGVSVGSGKLAGGASALTAGARDAAGGAGKIAKGSDKLSSGVSAAKVGAVALAGGLAQLHAGTDKLAEGLDSASEGSQELATGLTAGVEDVPAYSEAERDVHAEMMSDPVVLDTRKIDPVPNYGTGFAPYFIPLALWVGGLMVYFIVNPMPERAVRSGASGPVVALSGLWPGALLASAQAAIMYVVLRAVLGLHPVAPVLFFGFVVLTAVVFSAILQWLSVAIGPAGKVLGIVLLMLQLTSAAGTFPIETLPTFFRVINPWLPMTYVVAGLREVISGGDVTVMVGSAWALVAFGAIAFAGTASTAVRARSWDSERLKPLFEL
jgi:putative membrane protein